LHELGLFATRELDANDWSYSEGMLYTIPGRDTLLPELLSHAQVINTFGRSSQMLLGVHGLIPPDGWSDSSIAQLNAALYDTGGASFANASSLANAQRGAPDFMADVMQHGGKHGGGAKYQNVDLCCSATDSSLIALQIIGVIHAGEEVFSTYVPVLSGFGPTPSDGSHDGLPRAPLGVSNASQDGAGHAELLWHDAIVHIPSRKERQRNNRKQKKLAMEAAPLAIEGGCDTAGAVAEGNDPVELPTMLLVTACPYCSKVLLREEASTCAACRTRAHAWCMSAGSTQASLCDKCCGGVSGDVSLDTMSNRPRDCCRVMEVFSGLSTFGMAVCDLRNNSCMAEFVNTECFEDDQLCNAFSKLLEKQKVNGSQPFQGVHRANRGRFCDESAMSMEECDIAAVTPPCGQSVAQDVVDPETAAIAFKIGMCFYLEKWKMCFFENVSGYYFSEAWAVVLRGMLSGGYQHAMVRFTLAELGLPTKRERGYALAWKSELHCTASEWQHQVQYEIRRQAGTKLLLSECIVDKLPRLQEYGLIDDVADTFKYLTEDANAALSAATVKIVSKMDDWYVLDLGMSKERMEKFDPQPGVCPCITATNAWGRLYCTRLARYLYPQELMLIMGFKWAAIDVASAAVADLGLPGLRQLARRVGSCTSPVAWRVLLNATCVVSRDHFVGPWAPEQSPHASPTVLVRTHTFQAQDDAGACEHEDTRIDDGFPSSIVDSHESDQHAEQAHDVEHDGEFAVGSKVTYEDSGKLFNAIVTVVDSVNREYELQGKSGKCRFTHVVDFEVVRPRVDGGAARTSKRLLPHESVGRKLMAIATKQHVMTKAAFAACCPLATLSVSRGHLPGMWTVPSSDAHRLCASGGKLGSILGKQASFLIEWLDDIVRYMDRTGSKCHWENMFRTTRANHVVVRDNYRHLADLSGFIGFAMEAEDNKRAMKLLGTVGTALAAHMEGFTDEYNLFLQFFGVIRSRPSGDWNDVIDRMQRKHRDCTATIFAEVGLVHSLFVCGADERNIRVVCHETGEDKLLHLDPYEAVVIHGRWIHSGFGIPGASDSHDTYVIFAFVVMSKVVTVQGSWVKNNNKRMEEVYMVLTDLIRDDESETHLELPLHNYGRCDSCKSQGHALHQCYRRECCRSLCYTCMGVHNAEKCDKRQAPCGESELICVESEQHVPEVRAMKTASRIVPGKTTMCTLLGLSAEAEGRLQADAKIPAVTKSSKIVAKPSKSVPGNTTSNSSGLTAELEDNVQGGWEQVHTVDMVSDGKYTESHRSLEGFRRSQLAWAYTESKLEAEKVAALRVQELCQPLIKSSFYSGDVIWVTKGYNTWLVVRGADGTPMWSRGMNASTTDDTIPRSGTSAVIFEEGCLKNYAEVAVRSEHAAVLRIVCRMLAAELYHSLEMLEALLHMPFELFQKHIATQLLKSKWVWTTTSRVGMSKEDVIGSVDKYLAETRVHFGPERGFQGWMLMCDTESFVSLWDSCIKQQRSRDVIAPLLEVVVVVLCTLRETDNKSLLGAQRAITEMRRGGVGACIKQCLSECTAKKCTERCFLYKAFEGTFKEAEGGNVKTMRQLAKQCSWIVSDLGASEKVCEFKRGRKELLKVHGIGSVVYEKTCSLIRMHCADEGVDLVMAIDSRLECVRTDVVSKAPAQDHGDRFGYEPTHPWLLIAKAWSDNGFAHMGEVALNIAHVSQERLVYATNAARAMVAAHIQQVEPETAAQFCSHFGKCVRDNEVVTGLRECLRFICEVSALSNPGKYKMSHKPIQIRELSIEHTDPLHRVWVNQAGQMFGYMEEWLCDEDLAAWWCHPGQLVRLQGQKLKLTQAQWNGDSDAQNRSKHHVTGATEATLFTGETAWQAYKDALHTAGSVESLFMKLAQQKAFVTYWDFEPSCTAWEFKLCKTHNHVPR